MSLITGNKVKTHTSQGIVKKKSTKPTKKIEKFKGVLSAKIVNFCYPKKLADMIDALIKRVSVTYTCYEMYAHRCNCSCFEIIKKWTPSY